MVLTYMDIEEVLVVIDVECTSELAFTEEIVEHDACPNGNARSELLPSVAAIRQGGDELLCRVSKDLQ
jgi:hypothetical protein